MKGIEWISILIGIYLVVSVVAGARQGLVRQLLELLGVVLGLVFAFRYCEAAGRVIGEFVRVPPVIANIIGFGCIAVGIIVAARLLSLAWARLTRGGAVSVLDSVGGAVFGFLKGSAILCVVLVLIASIPVPAVKDRLEASPLAKQYLDAMPFMYERVEKALPADVPRLLITPEGISLKRVDFVALAGATCVKCGGKVRFEGMFQKGLAHSPKLVCTKCGRTSDGCQTYQGFHAIYGQCPVEKARQGYKIDCKVWPNGSFVLARGPCPVCGLSLGR